MDFLLLLLGLPYLQTFLQVVMNTVISPFLLQVSNYLCIKIYYVFLHMKYLFYRIWHMRAVNILQCLNFRDCMLLKNHLITSWFNKLEPILILPKWWTNVTACIIIVSIRSCSIWQQPTMRISSIFCCMPSALFIGLQKGYNPMLSCSFPLKGTFINNYVHIILLK